jgi:heat-inducible transcriptional repressor
MPSFTLNKRQVHVLAAIVQEYVATAQPVASKALADKFEFGVSPATLRNDMASLEEAALLRQPHTSAGRVPTENGYRLYLEQFVQKQKAICKPTPMMERVVTESQTPRDLVKDMARHLMKLSGETAVASLDTGWSHYTGISHLFHKPEFRDVDMLHRLSQAVDRFDDVLRDLFPDVQEDTNVWIGGENPFGKQMATIMVKYQLPNGMTGVLGLVGPWRMEYEIFDCLSKQRRY